MARRARRVAAWCLAAAAVRATLLVVPADAAAGPPSAVAIVQQARAVAAGGHGADAARLIDTWLTANGAGLGLPDAAVLRLEAAKHAAGESGDVALARHDLALADGVLLQLRGSLAPPLLARLQRESARSHERLGDFVVADRQLVGAVAGFGSADREPAADALNALGTIRLERGRPKEAADLFQGALERLGCATTASIPSLGCAAVFGNAANALATANDLPAARMAADGALRVAGNDPRGTRIANLARAQVLLRDTDPAAAEAALAGLAESAAGVDEQLRGFALYTAAVARFDRGLLPEAAQEAFAADIAYRNALGSLHPARARVLHLLAVVDTELGDSGHAASYFDEAEAMTRRSFGRASLQAAALSLERIKLDLRVSDIPSAKARLRATQAAISAAAEPDLQIQSRFLVSSALVAEAEHNDRVAAEALATARDLLDGPLHRGATPEIGIALLHLGRVQTNLGRFDAASVSLGRDLALQERLGASAATWKAEAVAALAALRLRRGDRRGALDQVRTAVSILSDQIIGGNLGSGPVRDEAREVLALGARIALDVMGPQAGLDDAFKAAQLAFASRTGDSVRQASARLANRDDALAALLREQEAVADRLRQADTLLRAALLQVGPETAAEETRLGALRDGLTQQLAILNRRLSDEYPRFAAYAAAAPMPMAEFRASLKVDEAILIPFDSERETLLFVATREAAQVVRSGLTHAAAAALVMRIRAGLDLGQRPNSGNTFTFDVDASEALYTALITPVTDALKGKHHLIIIASGPLEAFPPAVLLDPSSHEWLIRKFALSAWPSPSSLVAARVATKSSGDPATNAGSFLGVGDPQFGTGAIPGAARLPTLLPELRQAVLRLPALPETRDELSRMASLYPGSKTTLLLAQDATRGRLAESHPVDFGTIAFATHAAMAGELPGLLEPAIFMTPDARQTDDMGLLTASEIATMALNADLVMLSACNTAAPDGGPMAEGFSGLARAFFQAGARSLLVSHWAVNSMATARLTTDFLTRLHADRSGDKAEALRGAMLAMLDGDSEQLHYPAYWASFVVLGD